MQITRMVEVGHRSIECVIDLEDQGLYMEVVAVWQGKRNIIARVSEEQLLKIEISVTSNEYYEWVRNYNRQLQIDSYSE